MLPITMQDVSKETARKDLEKLLLIWMWRQLNDFDNKIPSPEIRHFEILNAGVNVLLAYAAGYTISGTELDKACAFSTDLLRDPEDAALEFASCSDGGGAYGHYLPGLGWLRGGMSQSISVRQGSSGHKKSAALKSLSDVQNDLCFLPPGRCQGAVQPQHCRFWYVGCTSLPGNDGLWRGARRSNPLLPSAHARYPVRVEHLGQSGHFEEEAVDDHPVFT